jgi:TolB protein
MVEFLPGQRARLLTIDIGTGESTLVFESDTVLFEAPNWSPDGEWLVVNANGGMLRVPSGGGAAPTGVELEGLPAAVNNDHCIAPDGKSLLVTARDGHLYEVPWAGGEARRITADSDPELRFKYYLHGVSPDGRTLSAIGGGLDASGEWVTNVYTLPLAGGPHTKLTDDPFPDDGAEFSPDGRELWFNSERPGDRAAGHAQLFRMALDGSGPTQVTHDERVNWFPHPSPDGRHVAYLSYPAGTVGHPPNEQVELRLIELEAGTTRTLAAFFGGQGTTNVPGWSPDSRRVAYVEYPV